MSEIAIAEQRAITITVCGDGEIEIAQEYGGRTHAVYVWPENVIALVEQLFRSAGLTDLYLHRTVGSSLWCDVPWPSDEVDDPDPLVAETVAALPAPPPQPMLSRNAAKQRAYRERQRALREGGNDPRPTPGNAVTPHEPVDLLSRALKAEAPKAEEGAR